MSSSFVYFPSVSLDMIHLGFLLCVISIVLNLCNQWIILPKEKEMTDKRYGLLTEVLEIWRNDKDGWSEELIQKKIKKIAAAEKKIGMLQNLFWVTAFLSFCGFIITLLLRVVTCWNNLHQ
ncbi:hypothetical protein MKW94_007203 [Papaver nudicaule]|uniref:Uncharacterized protein n=1 Tax=Papaver nudicaule TaxID=74823 RepID=A0AA41VY18_PAPNU|nr:hypothetical protein [Papaver nudicaule]